MRVVVAALIISVVPGGLVPFVATPEQSGLLTWWIGRVWVIAGIWLVTGPLWESGGSPTATADRR
jgi:hypothetical protein